MVFEMDTGLLLGCDEAHDPTSGRKDALLLPVSQLSACS